MLIKPEVIAGLALTLLIVPVAYAIYLALRCRSGWRVWLLYAITRPYCKLMFRWSAVGDCPFPKNGPALVLANHTSPVDPMLVWMDHDRLWSPHSTRPIGFLMAREYYDMPGLIGWICRVMTSVPVERQGRDMAPARIALRRLQGGDLIGVFPEGGINRNPPNLAPGNPGIAWLALKSKVPVYPVFIKNAPRGKSLKSSFYTKSRVTVVYGKPIDLSLWADRKLTQDVLREVMALLMNRLAEAGGVKTDEDDSVPPDERGYIAASERESE